MIKFSYEAGGSHDPPYTEEEEDAIVEAKKNDPASADEVFENLLIGNKAAAEDAQFLKSKSMVDFICTTHAIRKAIIHLKRLCSDICMFVKSKLS